MSVIKGLIIKDLLQLKNYKRTLFVFIIVFALTSMSQESTAEISSLCIVMMTFGISMFSVSTFNYDELAKADRYILTLPITKKEVILSKYILIVLSTLIGCIIGIFLSSIIIFIIKQQSTNIVDLLSIGTGAILGIGIVEAIQVPCIYKFGAEKGRIVLFIIAALVSLFASVMIFFGSSININFSFDSIQNYLPVIFIVLTMTVYYISYKISYVIYSKKEI